MAVQYLFTLVVVFSLLSGTAAAKCTDVQARGSGWMTGGLSAVDARQQALNAARQAALMQLGITVRTETIDIMHTDGQTDGALFYQLSRQISEGLFLHQSTRWETVEQPAKSGDVPLVGYQVTLQACVQMRQKDPALQVQAKLRNQKTGVFAEGATMQIDVSCSFACSTTIFNLLPDGKALVQVPSETVPQPTLQPGQPWRFPPKGIVLQLSTGSPAVKKVTEAYLIVATKEAVRPSQNELSFEALQEWLATLPVDGWADTVVPYQVIRR